MLMMRSLRPTFRASTHLVSSVHYLASVAGLRLLEQGGNAADAGVAAGLCLNVLEPELTHFGGVAPIIYGPGDGRPVETISGLGRWPRAASFDYFRENHGSDLPFGVLRCVVPAAPDAWLTALSRFGTMTFEEVVQPALALCAEGRPVDARCHAALAADETRTWPTTAAIYNPNGAVPSLGSRLPQPDLAQTFRRLVAVERETPGGRRAGIRAARDFFYRGEIAREIVDFYQTQGSLLTLEDFADFSVRIEKPEMIHYKGLDVYSCGPWCQGPAFLMLLQMLQSFDLQAMGHNSATYLHHLVESVKLVMADREAYFGDPDFVRVPMTGLLSRSFAAERVRKIDPTQAHASTPMAGDPWPYNHGPLSPADRSRSGVETDNLPIGRDQPERDTSYVCVVDRWGNSFSATPSDGYGSAPVVPGLGFPVSARGSQSWLVPGHPSAIAAGKRPRLTPNPAMILKDGKPYMPLGTPGADAQIQAMVQVFLNVVEFGMEPQEAIEAPRIISRSFPQSFWPHHTYPGEALIETRIDERTRGRLRQWGHILVEDGAWSKRVSRVCTIVADREQGTLAGGADPRSTSYAVGW